MTIPNYLDYVRQASTRWPAEWMLAHTGQVGTDRFIRLLASWLHYEVDSRVGLNWKRGQVGSLSEDILAFRGIGSAVDIVNGGPMEIVDVIAGAGGPRPTPHWYVAPGGPGDKGGWVKPERIHDSQPQPVPPPPPAPEPPRITYGELLGLMVSLHVQYGPHVVHPEVVAHWSWRLLVEGYTVDDIRQDAAERAEGGQ